ncbi:hypothetical protein GCM10023108_11310 [Saccharopolyspora hordei]
MDVRNPSGGVLAVDAGAVGEHALGAQQLQLAVPEVVGDRAVGAQDPVPRQVGAVLGEDAPHEPRRAQPGELGHVAVGEHRPGRDRRHDRPHLLHRLLVHGTDATAGQPRRTTRPGSGAGRPRCVLSPGSRRRSR